MNDLISTLLAFYLTQVILMTFMVCICHYVGDQILKNKREFIIAFIPFGYLYFVMRALIQEWRRL